jgi:hypothetical protein
MEASGLPVHVVSAPAASTRWEATSASVPTGGRLPDRAAKDAFLPHREEAVGGGRVVWTLVILRESHVKMTFQVKENTYYSSIVFPP